MVCSIFCFGKIGLLVNDNSKMKTTYKNIFRKYSKILKKIEKYSKIAILRKIFISRN
jgi:hypothetical protein